jgi:hypothetical protein
MTSKTTTSTTTAAAKEPQRNKGQDLLSLEVFVNVFPSWLLFFSSFGRLHNMYRMEICCNTRIGDTHGKLKLLAKMKGSKEVRTQCLQ